VPRQLFVPKSIERPWTVHYCDWGLDCTPNPIGVGSEEVRREPARAGVPIEEIPLPPSIPDAEKL
jgi:hypothetical protein